MSLIWITPSRIAQNYYLKPYGKNGVFCRFYRVLSGFEAESWNTGEGVENGGCATTLTAFFPNLREAPGNNFLSESWEELGA
jgi:hypothetical protein